MKSSLEKASRLTDAEEDVIRWAFNLAYSTVAGDWGLPKPMCYAVNNLQDAVHELAREHKMPLKAGCSEEFLSFYSKHYADLEKKIREHAAQLDNETGEQDE